MINEPGDDAAARWLCVSSATVFSSEWLELRQDTVVRSDGSTGTYDHVVVPESVTVLAIRDDGRVAVVRQWIYVHRNRQWRLPTGRVETTDSDLESAARRELLEETGISAECLVPIGTIHCGDSFSNLREHAFLATGLHQGRAAPEGGESDLETHWMPFRDVLDLVEAGTLPHAGSSFAVLAAQVRGLVAGG